MNLKGTKNNGFTPENRGSNYWQLKFFRLLAGLFFVFSVPNVSGAISPRVSKTIDSIENLNIYAHDTVKIRNYILLYDKLNESNPDTVLYFLDKALEIAYDREYEDYSGKIIFMKANVYNNGGDFTRSIELYKNALEIFSKYNNITSQINCYNKIGDIYLNLNIFDEAFNSYIDALKISNVENDPYIHSVILNNLGYVHQAQKKYQRALDYFKEALEINIKSDIKGGIAFSYNNIGAMYFSIGKIDSVLYYINMALKIYEEIGDIKTQSIPLYNIGEIYYEMEKNDEAISYVLKSYEIDKKFKDKAGMAKSLHLLGRIYSRKGFPKYGLELYEQALDLCIETNDIIEKKDIYQNISENYERLNEITNAFKFQKLYSQLKDSIYNLESSRLILELETKYQTEQQRKENELQKVLIDNQQGEIKQQFTQKITILSGFVLLFIISVIIYRSYKLKNKSNNLLMRQKEQIEQQNHKITSSIQYAKLIQTAALPPHELLRSIFEQHFVLFLPRDIVSGDFFWATHKDGFSIVACADCTGHGVPGAFMSMLGVSFLTEIVNRTKRLKADLILEELRRNIIDSLHQTGKIGESRDGMDIALCIINEDRTRLEYAGAFVPLVIIRDNNLIQISADKMPIGVHDDVMSAYTAHKVKLLTGDMIYLFTDGFADQFGGPFNKKFKVQPFLSLLQAHHNKSLIQQREILYDTIMGWRGDTEQIDDILIMGFRV